MIRMIRNMFQGMQARAEACVERNGQTVVILKHIIKHVKGITMIMNFAFW